MLHERVLIEKKVGELLKLFSNHSREILAFRSAAVSYSFQGMQPIVMV